MVAFGLGTVPLLAAAASGLRALLAQRPWTRKVLALGVLAAGLYGLAVRPDLTPPSPTRAAETR